MEVGEQVTVSAKNKKEYFSDSIFEKAEIKIKRTQGWNSGEWLVTITDDDELEALENQQKEDVSTTLSFWDFDDVEIQVEEDGWFEEWELVKGHFELEKHLKDFDEKSENDPNFDHTDFLEYIENELGFESVDGDSYFTGQICLEEHF